MKLKVKNWEKFQHFNNRRPPWVKLYRDILENPEWCKLSGDSAKLLVMLWLLASESDCGELPDINLISFRCRVDINMISTCLRELSHFLEVISEVTDNEQCHQDDISMISERYQVDIPERERETEKETEKEKENTAETKAPPVSSKKISFNFQTRSWDHVSEDDLSHWRKAYPAIDLDSEMAKAGAWLIANPKNRKSDYRRFLNSWFCRSQDRAPRAGDTNFRKIGHPVIPESQKRYGL